MLWIHTVLFPTDGSPCAEAARPLAERLAREHNATLHVLRVEVVPPVGDLRYDPISGPDERTAEAVVEARRRDPSAAEAVLAYADEVAADMIVMGTHGRAGVDRLLLGSTTEHVLRQAPCPVLTVGPEATAYADGPVLAPLAFESASDEALEAAIALAEGRGVPVVALHVVEPAAVPVPYAMALPPIDVALIVDTARQTLGRWVGAFADGPVPISADVEAGHAATVIVERAKELGAEMLVMASHGRRGLGRWLLGSVTEEVVRHAPCPVLTLRVGARQLLSRPSAGRAVPRDDWRALFDALSARAAKAPYTVTVSVVSPQAQGAVYDRAPFVGITFDPADDAVEVAIAGGEHHVVRPFAVRAEAGAWALDAARDADAPGPWTVEVVRADGGRERIDIARA